MSEPAWPEPGSGAEGVRSPVPERSDPARTPEPERISDPVRTSDPARAALPEPEPELSADPVPTPDPERTAPPEPDPERTAPPEPDPVLVLAARRWQDAGSPPDPTLLLATLGRSTLHLPAETSTLLLGGREWLPVFSTRQRAADYAGAAGLADADGTVDVVALPAKRIFEHYLPPDVGVVVDSGEQHQLVLAAGAVRDA